MVKSFVAAESDSEDVEDVTAKPAKNQGTAAALDALHGEAIKGEQAGQQEQQQQADKQEKQQTDTIEADLQNALAMAAGLAEPALWWLTPKEFEQQWGKAVQKNIAENGAEIMRRNGVSMGGLMKTYGPYIGLGGALLPSTLATVAAYKREKAKLLTSNGGSDGASTQAG